MSSNQDPDLHRVWVFFYGTFMSARVLQEHGIDCKVTVPASLKQYRLEISPRSDLLLDDDEVAYGSLAHVKVPELAKLYLDLKNDFGLDYKPADVVVQILEGGERKAVCYFCGEMSPTSADPTYIDEMLRCCEELALPDSYAQLIESFRP